VVDYCTQSDLEARFGDEEVLLASDRDGSGVADAAAISACITAASGEVDSYVRARYDLPLTIPVPEHLEHVACDITMYKLSAHGPAYTEEKRVRYEDAISWLLKLSKGIVTLGDGEADEVASDNTEVSTIVQDRLFTRTTLSGVL
jgi:phage gp36-like protein